MIAVTVSHLIMNQVKVRLVHNQKENSHYDHIPLNLSGIGDKILRLQWYTMALKRGAIMLFIQCLYE